jgi:hypothetical protein
MRSSIYPDMFKTSNQHHTCTQYEALEKYEKALCATIDRFANTANYLMVSAERFPVVKQIIDAAESELNFSIFNSAYCRDSISPRAYFGAEKVCIFSVCTTANSRHTQPISEIRADSEAVQYRLTVVHRNLAECKQLLENSQSIALRQQMELVVGEYNV